MAKNDLLRERLNDALVWVEDPRQLVGQDVPPAAAEWAETNGLAVVRTKFAPPGRLYIVGAVPVVDLDSVRGWEEQA